ncbi:uncharacterized protein TRIADDRAFT_53911 [Trichoplax adhaerens]|uniref:Uncharacterized protein n=1 Tax=Trichoplax adhaerens TaxID=10228 RepID=B3RMD6_TRIAD|nr:predicted protein [Trichoplax adhaerens]EDV28347.1 predicted protein [Trichoplax adhaerens]|eukprot:XP_002110181.1 predicted protein [Trichoplax adhaerens]
MYYSSEIGAFIKEIDDKILQYSTALQGNLTLNEDCSHDFQSWCQMHNLMPGYAYSAFKYGEFHPIIQNLSIFKIRCWLVSRIIFEANNVCNEIGKEWQNQGITLKFWLNKILSSIARYLNDPLLTQGFVQPNYEYEDMDDFTNYMQPDYPKSESTSTMDIIMGSEPIADMDELSVCRFTIMIKLSLMYLRLLETMPRNISENLANYQQGLQEHEVTAIMSDIEVMPRLIEELLPKIDELYMEMLDVYDLKSHEEIWIKLKQWKRNTRNIESASALFSLKPVMQELIEIKNSMINRLRYDADIMQIADETINMLQVFQNRLLPVQDLINKISMIRIEICDLHNNLLSKSFFVIIHCYRAPKSNGNIKCHLVLRCVAKYLLRCIYCSYNDQYLI